METNGWYYAVAGERKGPITGAELSALAAAGTVTPATLVWREGMAGWEPFAQAVAASPTIPSATSGGTAACAECGRTAEPGDLVELAGRRVCASCKPVVLQRLQEGVPNASAESEAIRRAHLNHEASIKSWGFLQMVGGVITLAVGGFVVAGILSDGIEASLSISGAFALGAVAYGGILLWLGIGLRKLRPGARIGSAILAGIGLLGFPVGTLINGYVLYLLLSQKGRTIFSDAYRRVVTETPHVKYRTPVWVWILVVLVVLALIGAIGLGMSGGR